MRSEVDGVTLGTLSIIPFSLIPDRPSFQLIPVHDLVAGHDALVLFILMLENIDEIIDLDVHIVTCGERVIQPPLVETKPFKGIGSRDVVIREHDEMMRQLQSTQTCISIWSLLASFTAHRDALIRALSQIRVEFVISLNSLIHMLTADRATCIVFSINDLPLEA